MLEKGYVEFGTTPEEIENERKRLLIYAFAGLGSVFLFVFGILSLMNDHLLLGGVLLLCLGIVSILSLVARKLKKVQPVSIFLATVLLFLASFLLLGGGAEGTGVYWSYSLSMLMVLVVGPKAGGIYMGVYILVSSFFIFGQFQFVYDYSYFESTRIIVTSVTLYVLILASEWIRVGSYSAISRTSESHRSLANTDPLTKLLNRHGVQAALEEKKILQPVVLVLLDVDNFKIINDCHGHDFGDSVLEKLSELIKNNTKGGDISARWGGEEFLLVLFDMKLEYAETLLNKIKSNFENYPFISNGNIVSVTFSAGVSTLYSKSSFECSIKIADQRLYNAKQSGRNRVVVC